MTKSFDVRVGVLALQGGFHEHADLLKQAAASLPAHIRLTAHYVRTAAELASSEALIIPGGESTTIMLLAEKGQLLEPLRQFVRGNKPVWGTCAGMICLADQIYVDPASPGTQPVKKQNTIGGVDIAVVRNQYGRQLASFEYPLAFGGIRNPEIPFPGVFIRAPIVHHRLSFDVQGPDALEVLATVPQDCLPQPKMGSPALGPDAHLVAVRQGNLLATSFHPELSTDPRIHEYFLEKIVLPAHESSSQ